jgi:hypothetical protein
VELLSTLLRKVPSAVYYLEGLARLNPYTGISVLVGGGEGRRRIKAFGSLLFGVLVMFSVSVVYPEEWDFLRPEEFASLRELLSAPEQCRIPMDHISRLLALDLICLQLGKPCITPLGTSRLAAGL